MILHSMCSLVAITYLTTGTISYNDEFSTKRITSAHFVRLCNGLDVRFTKGKEEIVWLGKALIAYLSFVAIYPIRFRNKKTYAFLRSQNKAANVIVLLSFNVQVMLECKVEKEKLVR